MPHISSICATLTIAAESPRVFKGSFNTENAAARHARLLTALSTDRWKIIVPFCMTIKNTTAVPLSWSETSFVSIRKSCKGHIQLYVQVLCPIIVV